MGHSASLCGPRLTSLSITTSSMLSPQVFQAAPAKGWKLEEPICHLPPRPPPQLHGRGVRLLAPAGATLPLLACLSRLPLAQIPEAWLLLANVVVVLILVPVKDHLLDPLLLRCKLLPSALQKMALGMGFGFASVIVAGVRA